MKYLDASVLVPLVYLEDATDLIYRYVGDRCEWIVSDFATGEVASAVGRLVRSRSVTSLVGEEALVRFDNWREARASTVEVVPSDVGRATRFLHRFDLGLRLPDAIHLAICRRLGLTLVSFDRRLLNAASALVIPTEVPEA